jgi:branched-subunit amino acid transport protein
MPGLIIPFLIWPDATGGTLDAPRLIAAFAAFGIGIWQQSALWSVIAGIATLYTLMFILG